jgi:hypothetical protein
MKPTATGTSAGLLDGLPIQEVPEHRERGWQQVTVRLFAEAIVVLNLKPAQFANLVAAVQRLSINRASLLGHAAPPATPYMA